MNHYGYRMSWWSSVFAFALHFDVRDVCLPSRKTSFIKPDYFIRAVKLKVKGITKSKQCKWPSPSSHRLCPVVIHKTFSQLKGNWQIRSCSLYSGWYRTGLRPCGVANTSVRPHEGPRKTGTHCANLQLSFPLCADMSAKHHLSYERSTERMSIEKCG